MYIPYYAWASYAWMALGILWLLGLSTTKRTVRRQSPTSRILQGGLALLGFGMVFNSYFRTGWLAARFVPESSVVESLGLALTWLSIGFAMWSRWMLGSNWSGTVTLKEEHELICRGPYRLVRHPIYTGLLFALLGTALIVGEVRGLYGVGVLLLAFWLKSRTEEGFLLAQFGERYLAYSREVRALIPFVL